MHEFVVELWALVGVERDRLYNIIYNILAMRFVCLVWCFICLTEINAILIKKLFIDNIIII
jgi:hypothetical protein